MNALSNSELKSLIECEDKACISIYMPTHRTGQEVQQDPIRLKNLLVEAEERLLASGHRRREMEEMLAPIRALVRNGLFWQHQGDGLAILSSSSLFRHYRIARGLVPLVVVGERFHIKPLLSLLSNGGRFYLLTLSLGQIRLFQGTRWGLSAVDLGEGPASLDEAIRYDDPEKQLQFHTSTRGPGGVGQRPATFHGQGVSADDEKANILRFFHRLDQAVRSVLGGDEPLVLAGVEHLPPLYREANSYPHLVEDAIQADPEALPVDDLHERAWQIVEPHFAADRRAAAVRYAQLAGAGGERASDELEQVVLAAYRGRVASLFVAAGVQRWGSFDADANLVRVRAERAPGGEDLLDFAAVHTLLHGGAVYLVETKEVPGGSAVAAIFRY
jgi:hypothetical protein